jgi:flagellar basal body-associated protein FliL
MKEVKRVLMVMLMAVILSVTLLAQMSAFGQKGDNNNRPPKEEQRVKERDKQPPPRNSNSKNSNGNRHG